MDCVSHNLRLLLKKIKPRSIVFDMIGTMFFLIYNKLLLYMKERPTHSTHQQTDILSSHIPIIRVCPQPGLDLNQVTSSGYETLYSYFAGFQTEEEVNFIGWKGKSKSHPLDILEENSIVKNASDLVESATFHGHGVEKIDSLVQLEKAMYPFGQCISLTLTNKLIAVINLEIVFNLGYIQDHKIENVKVFMQDPQLDVKSLSPLFALAGDTFIKNYDTLYNLEIFLTKSLEEHPKANCRMIFEDYSFKECFENEIMTKFRNLIGCIPPWFTNVRGDVCNHALNISRKKLESVSNIFFDLFAGTLKTNCPEPCSVLRFVSRYVRFEQGGNKTRLYINFPKTVSLHQQEFNIDLFSFIVR